MRLDKEEKILDAYDNGDLKPIPNVKKEMAKYREYAKSTLHKNKRINIRISQRDLINLQRNAVQEGLPYQTLISSILHKYVNSHIAAK